MSHRYFVDLTLHADQPLDLPAATVRHIQAVRSQPGDAVVLFNGDGQEWSATITHMGRSQVSVQLHQAVTVDRELPWNVTLAVVVPANERMDWLVEKATELGVHTLQPLLSQRSVVRLTGERASKRQAHWAGVAMAAAEQSGRTRVPVVAPLLPLATWLSTHAQNEPASPDTHWLLCAPRDAAPDAAATPAPSAQAIAARLNARALARADALPSPAQSVTVLSGPEGGLTDDEIASAQSLGWGPTSLGPRTLRADTAPLMALAAIASLSP